jgi:hypothetical protein
LRPAWAQTGREARFKGAPGCFKKRIFCLFLYAEKERKKFRLPACVQAVIKMNKNSNQPK